VEIGGYDGGGFIHVPSAFFMCRRSDAKVARKTGDGTTRKKRWYSWSRPHESASAVIIKFGFISV
jgi:hypothetical protein